MSKHKKTIKPTASAKKKESPIFSFEDKLSNKTKWILSHLIIVLAVIIFFTPIYFGGKTIVSGDILNMHSYTNFFDEAENFLWDPYIFLGMPMFGNVGWFDFFGHSIDMLKIIYSNIFESSYGGWTIYLFLLGFFYLYLMRYLKASTTVAVLVALAAIFSTGIILLYFIGHITKLLALIVFPLVILFLLRMNERIRLIDILLFILAMHFLLKQWHMQIIFYIFFTVGIYYLYFIIRGFYLKDKLLQKSILKSLGAFTVVAIVAFGMNYYKLQQINEYTPYSTRGTPSLMDQETKSQTKTDEEFYQYATNWSFSPGEIMTFIFPSFYGFGSSVYKGPLTNNQEVEVNTYFGQMPFVDVAQYMGVIIFALGLLGIFLRWREPLVQFLTILIIISLLLSFGRTLPVLYDLFFYNIPFFDKFRAPSMILNLVQLSFPILAGLGLMKLLSIRELKDEALIKKLKITAIVLSSLLVVSLLLSQPISSWFVERVASAGQKGQQLKPLYDYMSSMFLTDVFLAFGFTAAVFWLGYLTVKGNMAFDAFIAVVIVLVVIDLWRIDNRGVNFVPTSEIEQRFAMPDYIRAIKAEKNQDPYRLLNLKQDGSPGSINQNNNFHVYFLEEDFFGYSGIKPRSYQNIIDVIGPGNPTLWRMLNVRYIITEQPVNHPDFVLIQSSEKTFTYRNMDALPRAYFVNRVEQAQPLQLLNSIKANEFEPADVAFVEENLQLNIQPPGEGASVNFVNYETEKVELDVVATGNNLLFLGSTYYPVGWKATIDGNQLEIIKLNHGFMGVVVPEGKHRIVFSFEPASYYTGRYVPLIFNILILAGLVLALLRRRKEVEPESQVS
jgi:hypothetical protein